MERISLVRRLHDSDKQVVLAATGGGSLAISDLLTQSGASKTILGAYIPYSPESLAWFLGQKPTQACSAQTARGLAMACFQQGRQAFEKNDQTGTIPNSTASYRQKEWCPHLLGVGCTASLASDYPKKGEHRFHIAIQSYHSTSVVSLVMQKGARTRLEEERLVADCILQFLAEAADIPCDLSIPLLEGEHFMSERTIAEDPWIELLFGDAVAVLLIEGQPVFTKKIADIDQPTISESRLFSPEVEYMQNIFAGSFAPMHQGHLRMIELAQERLCGKIALEISVDNVDKAPLDYMEIEHRLRRIDEMIPGQAVWLTQTTRFLDKSLLFRGATFLAGADTIKRIGDQKYYANNHSLFMEALHIMTHCGCRFLAFARPTGGTVEKLQTLKIPDMLRTLCDEVPESEFCEDISSTAIREYI